MGDVCLNSLAEWCTRCLGGLEHPHKVLSQACVCNHVVVNDNSTHLTIKSALHHVMYVCLMVKHCVKSHQGSAGKTLSVSVSV